MGLGWLEVNELSFNALLLLERFQIGLLPRYAVLAESLGIALRANPAVIWFFRHKCPEVVPWLERTIEGAPRIADPIVVRAAEVAVLEAINDWLVYAIDPAIYDAQPFSSWPNKELTSVVDLRNKTVLDAGAGTGRLALIAAPMARIVFAVEPVENLRRYLRQKAQDLRYGNVYVVDGLIEAIPYPARFFDVALSGHVFGGDPEAEHRELMRVTRSGGMIVHCPGTAIRGEEEAHRFLLAAGYECAEFHDGEGTKRKYWKRV